MNTETLEANLIGMCLNDERAARELVYSGLKPKHFETESLRQIWSVIWTLVEDDKQVDLPTVGGILPEMAVKLSTLVINSPIADKPRVWADAVMDRARDRDLIRATQRALQIISHKVESEAFAKPSVTNDALDEVFSKLYASEDNAVEIGPEEAFSKLEKIWEEEHQNGYKGICIPTGFPDIDRAMNGGIPRGAMMTMAAKTGQGKSIMAINIGCNAALAGYKVLYVTVEMDWREAFSRFIASHCGGGYSKILRGPRSDPEFDAFHAASKAMVNKHFYVFDRSYRKITEVEKRLRFASSKKKYDLVILDYIGQFKLYDNYMRAHEQIGHVSAYLKSEIAKRHNVAVLCVAQMNRNAEAEGESGMRLGNIADAAGIERDSDVVSMLVREDQTGCDDLQDELSPPPTGICWLRFSKQRHGKPCRVGLKFNGDAARFETLPKAELDSFLRQKAEAEPKAKKRYSVNSKFKKTDNIKKHWTDDE